MTAKLVKARYKTAQYLPEWAKCCTEGMARLRGAYEIEIGTALNAPAGLDACPFCGCEVPSARIVKAACGCWIPIDCLDLDEGPTA